MCLKTIVSRLRGHLKFQRFVARDSEVEQYYVHVVNCDAE